MDRVWPLVALLALLPALVCGLGVTLGNPPARPRLPFWVKLACTGFVCVLVPAYWAHYGPANFLWFSDIALFLAVAALWREDSLLASMAAVSVTPLEVAWGVDFLLQLAGL